MRRSPKKTVLSFLAIIVVCGVIAWAVIYYNPALYTDIMMRLGKYDSIVNYYNNTSIVGSNKQAVDSIIQSKIDSIYEACKEYLISYEEGERILLPFLDIKNDKIHQDVESYLSYLRIEKTGNEYLNKAESFFYDMNYLQTVKCLKYVDVTYSNYRALKELCDESVSILLSEIGTPNTANEYLKAIRTLDSYYSVTGEEAFKKQKQKFQEELDEYRDTYEIIQKATEEFESKRYKESFHILEEGIIQYPNSNKLKYAIDAYRNAYIILVTAQVTTFIQDKNDDDAKKLLEEAIENYNCKQFLELLDSMDHKESIASRISATLSDAGEYVFHSGKKLILGDFAPDEEETALSLGGSIAASLVGIDTPLDVRDLAYDISHWGEGEHFIARFALDVAGVIPVIGAVKYLKHADTAVDIAKAIKKGADVADAAHDVANAADAAHDLVNAADTIHDATNLTDAVHDASNTVDTIHDITKTAEAVEDINKQADGLVKRIIINVTEKANNVPDLADDLSDTTRNVEKIDDVADTARSISKKGGRYGDIFKAGESDLVEVHHIPPDCVTDLSRRDGPAIRMDKADHRMTASCGNSFETRQYIYKQRQLINEGRFSEAVKMDIDDIRSKFGDKYDDAINEMLEYIDKLIKEGRISG